MIDTVDYALLKCILEDERSPWKKRIHETVLERADELPGLETISQQTVGRRIDQLHEDGILDSCITHADQNLERDLMIGYKLTETGREVFRAKRAAILEEQMFGPASGQTDRYTPTEIATLLMDEFDLAPDSLSLLRAFDREELTTLFAYFHARQHLDTLLTETNRDRLQQLLAANPHLTDLLQGVDITETPE